MIDRTLILEKLAKAVPDEAQRTRLLGAMLALRVAEKAMRKAKDHFSSQLMTTSSVHPTDRPNVTQYLRYLVDSE